MGRKWSESGIRWSSWKAAKPLRLKTKTSQNGVLDLRTKQKRTETNRHRCLQHVKRQSRTARHVDTEVFGSCIASRSQRHLKMRFENTRTPKSVVKTCQTCLTDHDGFVESMTREREGAVASLCAVWRAQWDEHGSVDLLQKLVSKRRGWSEPSCAVLLSLAVSPTRTETGRMHT